jgi:hypothetical protein
MISGPILKTGHPAQVAGMPHCMRKVGAHREPVNTVKLDININIFMQFSNRIQSQLHQYTLPYHRQTRRSGVVCCDIRKYVLLFSGY